MIDLKVETENNSGCVYVRGVFWHQSKGIRLKVVCLKGRRELHPPSASGILVLDHEIHSTKNRVPGEVYNVPSIVVEHTQGADQPPKGGDLIRVSHQLLHRPTRLLVQHVTELGSALGRWEGRNRGERCSGDGENAGNQSLV